MKHVNRKRKLSQKARILALLREGHTLTPMFIIHEIGCTKLATRVSELINKEGHTEIRKKEVYVADRDGAMVRVMSYYIEPKDRRAA